MSHDALNTTILLKAVQFAAFKHRKAIKLADKIANARDVTESPPATWDLAERTRYLDWTEKVIARCRGTNASLERCYDEVLHAGRAKLASI